MVADVDNAAAAGFRDATAFNMVIGGRASVKDELHTSVAVGGDDGQNFRGSADLVVELKIDPLDIAQLGH